MSSDTKTDAAPEVAAQADNTIASTESMTTTTSNATATASATSVNSNADANAGGSGSGGGGGSGSSSSTAATSTTTETDQAEGNANANANANEKWFTDHFPSPVIREGEWVIMEASNDVKRFVRIKKNHEFKFSKRVRCQVESLIGTNYGQVYEIRKSVPHAVEGALLPLNVDGTCMKWAGDPIPSEKNKRNQMPSLAAKMKNNI